jgi:pantoate--beta-alanine ligase
MLLFKGVKDVEGYLRSFKSNGREVGFVPTMGALHEGHLSLVRRSKAENDLTVVSIFVNPTQFNEASDLEKYPRTESSDIKLLLQESCDVLFLPTEAEVYPPGLGDSPQFAFGKLAEVLEGAFRPGHFAGVAQVVHRLLEIIAPDNLYMGQKDYQQVMIIRSMLEQLKWDTRLVMCPIVREAHGLAMSSRNKRLDPDERSIAGKIYEVLQAAEKWKQAGFLPVEIKERALRHLERVSAFAPEYVEVVHALTLEPLERFSPGDPAIICTSVWVGGVRLIDNHLLDELPL